MPQFTIRRSVGQITLSGPEGVRDLSPFFTVSRNSQGLKWERAGEYQRTVVNPLKDWLLKS